MDHKNNNRKFEKKISNNFKGICKNSHCHSCSKFLKKNFLCKIINNNNNNIEISCKEPTETSCKDYLCPNTLNDVLKKY